MNNPVTTTTDGNKPFGGEKVFGRKYVWQWPVRIFHWLNAACICVLLITGLYIAFPVFSTSGEASNNSLMGNVRLVHFAAANTFFFIFVVRMYWFWFGNNYARSGFPFFWRKAWWYDLFRQAWDYLKLERGHVHLGHNALGGLTYTIFVVGLGWVQVLTGYAMYSESNPGGLADRLTGWVIPLLGGSFQNHMWHHLAAWGFLVFSILHIYIVFYDGQQFRNGLVSSMISGFKFFREDDIDNDKWLS